jgi:hypothetical protein
MKHVLKLTVVLGGPVYTELVAELDTLPSARARAGWLKHLAESGVRAAPTGALTAGSRHANASATQRVQANEQFDMCVTIREEEFPCLYGALSSARKGKARALLLKRFANDALRMRGGSCIPSATPESHAHESPTPAGIEDDCPEPLALPPNSLLSDFCAGFLVR